MRVHRITSQQSDYITALWLTDFGSIQGVQCSALYQRPAKFNGSTNVLAIVHFVDQDRIYDKEKVSRVYCFENFDALLVS